MKQLPVKALLSYKPIHKKSKRVPQAIHFRAKLAGLCPVVLSLLMTIGTQGSAKGVGREASINILSKGQILVTHIKENGSAEYHVIYKGDFYWCTSWGYDGRATLGCLDTNPRDE